MSCFSHHSRCLPATYRHRYRGGEFVPYDLSDFRLCLMNVGICDMQVGEQNFVEKPLGLRQNVWMCSMGRERPDPRWCQREVDSHLPIFREINNFRVSSAPST